ncbi:hypothetical protein KI387_029921, partial [Taxus chinensis]
RFQPLDYKNTTFRCRICKSPGQLHASCPFNRNTKNSKKGALGWGTTSPYLVSAMTFKEDSEKENNENGVEKSAVDVSNNKVVLGGTKCEHSPRNSDSEPDFLPDSTEAEEEKNLIL